MGIAKRRACSSSSWGEIGHRRSAVRGDEVTSFVGEVSADREFRVFRTTDPHGRILDFLDRSRYYLLNVYTQLANKMGFQQNKKTKRILQVLPQLYSRG
jgi:hypothetical protein